jgi:hypothetical protein
MIWIKSKQHDYQTEKSIKCLFKLNVSNYHKSHIIQVLVHLSLSSHSRIFIRKSDKIRNSFDDTFSCIIKETESGSDMLQKWMI